jgi:hypothetical protein
VQPGHYHWCGMEAWRTYTPDGRMLEVEFTAGEWTAHCGGVSAVGASALEAISEAVGSEESSIGAAEPTLDAWVAEHAAQLESEAG